MSSPVEIFTWGHWETDVLGQILAKTLLEPDFGNLAPRSRRLKLPSGIRGKRPFWATILARSRLEANCGKLAPCNRLLKMPSRILGQRPFGAKSWPGGFRTQMWAIWRHQADVEIGFWNHWETAVLGQILARHFLEPDFGTLAPCSCLLKLPSGILGKRPF